MAEYQLLCWKILYVDGTKRRIKSAAKTDFTTDSNWNPTDYEIYEPGKKVRLDKWLKNQDATLHSHQIFWDTSLDAGSHDGSNNSGTLTDTSKSWTIDEHVGKWLYNTTDGSYTKITSNTATTISGNLKSGIDDDWDTGDSYVIRSYVKGDAIVKESQALSDYIKDNAVWTDSLTDIYGGWNDVQTLTLRRELYGDLDTENPVHVDNHDGALTRISNVETIHNKKEWHGSQIVEARYKQPGNLLIYYGGPNAFNSAKHAWNNELIAQEMAKYSMIVLGNGLPDIEESGTHDGSSGAAILSDSSKSWSTNEWLYHQVYNTTDGSHTQCTASDGTTVTGTLSGGTDNDWDSGDAYEIRHPDYINMQTIIDRVKALNPQCLIFGYVSVNMVLAAFETKCDNWDAVGVHGIFMDEAGYEYGSVATNGRVAFNAKVDYVHGLTNAVFGFVNAWNQDHIIGTVNDTSYPNTTWNSGVVESNLTQNDWYLLESSPINTTAFSGTGGYQSKTDWFARAEKAVSHRATYGINTAAVGIISNSNVGGQALFDFGYIAAMMHSLEAYGTSDVSYGATNSAVEFWLRPDVSGLGILPWKYPGVEADGGDSDLYWRYVQFGRLSLDFSSGAEFHEIERYTDDYDDPSKYWKISDHFEGQYLNNIWLPSNSGANSTIVKKVGSPSAQTFRAGDAAGRYATVLNAYQTIGVDQEPLMKAGVQLVHTSDISVYFGLWDSTADRIEFFADTGSGYWVARNTDGGATTPTTTSVALDTDWHHFEIRVTGARILFFIDHALVAAHSADITAEEMYLRFQVVTDAGTAVREANLDYLWARGKVGY